ncbi:helicase-related protein [Mycoplasmatota bacterium WC30]
MIEKLYKSGNDYIERVKAVTKDRCNRCLSSNIYRDGFGNYSCLDCYKYGEINDKMAIYRYSRKVNNTNHRIELDYQLSAPQIIGSKFLLDCYLSNQSAFLQAVCGAGKTEMTYQVILSALKENKKVCFVLPRVEVLKEVSKRFIKHFPNTNISVLYEGHKNYQDANLIFSTPQQLICFFKEFDLLILDEVDAFPYAKNDFLKRLVEKSLKRNSVVLYMSATISDEYQKMIDNKSILYHSIPSRYHRKPLVVPIFKRISNAKNYFKTVLVFLSKNYEKHRQTLIFVPTVKLGEELKIKLNNLDIDCNFVSSKSADKNSVIKKFRRKEYIFLISTTVLERGVTFADIDCVVIQADHRVFSKETLIQISGRVGRKLEYTQGKVILYSEYISSKMKRAKKEILLMNRRNGEK